MKKCTKCKKLKELTEFYKDSRLKSGIKACCKECDKKHKKAYYQNGGKLRRQEYVSNNSEKVKAYNKKYRNKFTNFQKKNDRKWELIQYKGCRCYICGLEATKDIIACFDFHHDDPQKDDNNVSDLYFCSKDRLYKEVEKTHLLCSNCHRIYHHRQSCAKLHNLGESATTIESISVSRVGNKLLISEAVGLSSEIV